MGQCLCHVGTKFPSSLAGIAEVPDISFREKAHSVTEDDQTVSVCAVAGKLAEDILPLKVTISTTNDTAKSKLIIRYSFIAEGRRCSDLWHMTYPSLLPRSLWHMTYTSLLPRSHPAFYHLQFGKAGEDLCVSARLNHIIASSTRVAPLLCARLVPMHVGISQTCEIRSEAWEMRLARR